MAPSSWRRALAPPTGWRDRRLHPQRWLLFSIAVTLALLWFTPVSADAFTYADTNATPFDDVSTELCLTPLTRTFTVPDYFLIADLNFGFTADHAYRSDIRLVLQSPSGARAEIMTEFFMLVEDENENYDLLLDSAATGELDDGDADDTTAPYYERAAQPSNSLTIFNGEQAHGVWTLEICDAGILDAGFYQRSQLFFDGIPVSPPPAANTISGRIYRDYNADGVNDLAEPGVAGLTLHAYSDAGATFTSITDSRGRYTLTVPSGVAVRLELAELPTYLQPGPAGPDGATTIALITSPADAVDIAVANPGQYCQEPGATNIAVACLIYGGRTGAFQDFPTLVSLAEQDGSFAAVGPTEDPANLGYDPPRTAEATQAQTGALWGIAFDSRRGQLYASSLVKRHVALGSTDNPTTIYAVSPYTDTTVTPWITLDPVRPDPHNNPNEWHEDFAVFDAVGKTGLGDLDIAEDFSALYTVDLETRNLVIIPINADGTPGAPTNLDLMAHLPAGLIGPAADQCPALTDIRPFGLGVRDGAVYVGLVCSAQSTVPAGALPIQAPTADVAAGPRPGDPAKLRAYVLRWNGDTATPAFTAVLDFSLNYERGCTSDNQLANCKSKYDSQWAPWVDAFPYFDFTNSGPYNVSYPEPILSDIEFYNEGLVLFFTDRFGHQTGSFTDTSRGESIKHVAGGGDILYACPQNGGWVLEELISGDPSCGTAGSGFVSGTDRIDEYFFEDTFRARFSLHNDVAFGSGAAIPGRDTVVATVYDPIYRGEGRDPLYDGGLHWYTVADGHYRKSVRLYDGDGDPQAEGYLMKATGLGDLTALCAAAPVEIGNRVWRDDNGDGLQSATEPGLAGVTVELLCPATGPDGQPGTSDDSAPVATATTDGAGQYYFSSHRGASSASARYGLAIPFQAACQLRIPNATGPAAQAPLQGLTLTEADDATPTATGSDRSDSDGGLAGDAAVVDLTIGGPGANNHTYDFGFAPGGPVGMLNLGNLVWHDADNDGQKDADEAGLAGATLALYRAGQTPGQDAPLTTTVTSAAGWYAFNGLTADVYTVCATPPATHPYSSDPTDNADNGQDDDDNGAPVAASDRVCSPPIALADGAEPLAAQDGDGADGDLTIDFGFYERVQVGDDVWYDHDRNGAQDAGESGVAGVTAHLLRQEADGSLTATGQTATTDSAGRYRFADLPPGAYAVRFDLATLPAGYTVTQANLATITDDMDSDAAPDNGQTPATPYLPSGAQDLTLDLGIYRPVVQIGDYLWQDQDSDGLQDDDEPGLSGVTVHLLRADGSDAGQNTVTDATGHYLFSNLPPSAYAVRFDLTTLPATCGVTRPNAGADNLDSDADPNTGATAASAPLSDGQQELGLDLGCAPIGVVRIGDYVWDDLNRNGVQEPGEPGVGGVTVHLLHGDGSETGRSTVTDAAGRYHFADLPPGFYTVAFETPSLPANYRITARDAIGNDSIDSDSDASGRTAPTGNLAAGQQDLTLDLGVWRPVVIGDYVWIDADGDGCQDADETGVAGVTVRLFSAHEGQPASGLNGAPVAPQTTDASGHYRFVDLPAGNYFVRFEQVSLPAGYRITRQSATCAEPSAASAGDPATGQSSVTGPLGGGAVDLTLDLGLVAPVNVGDRVWLDANRNSQQDTGEANVANMQVQLCRLDNAPIVHLDGAPVAPQVTDANGGYRFTNLPPGDYCVQFDLATAPAGYVATAPNQGNDTTDSDANPGTGRSGQSGFLLAGQADLTLDLGLMQPQGVRIGDYVWHDRDADGQQGATEPSVAGVTVALLGLGGAEVARTATDDDGFYLFPNLPPGAYSVAFDLAALPPGYRVTSPDRGADNSDSDGDPTSGRSASTQALANGEQDLTLDLGLYQLACLGDYTWRDRDGDGAQDVGEAPLVGVTVTLLDSAGVTLRTAVTGDDGRYQFCDLAPGSYRLHFAAPLGYYLTARRSLAGERLADDSDADPANGQTAPITLQSGQNDSAWDAGFVSGASLGNYVWHDQNGDGLQAADEPALAGVVVRLYTAAGVEIGATATDQRGFYGFTELTPGQYCLIFTPPAAFIPTAAHQGGDAARDSDALNGCTALITLTDGEHDLTWDAGFTLPAALGSAVWLDRVDQGNQGIREISERDVPGVTVVLYDDSGAEIARTTTDENGYFLFNNLPPGSYLLEFIAPPEYDGFTSRDVGNTEGFDSDVDPQSGRTPMIVLAPGENQLTWFAGLLTKPTALDEETEPANQWRGLYLPFLRYSRVE